MGAQKPSSPRVSRDSEFGFALSRGVRAKHTSDPARLIAARGVIDDPQAAWRSVSAVAVAVILVLGLLLIRLGVVSTAPVLRRVLEAPARGE